jgi:hypothetical protein
MTRSPALARLVRDAVDTYDVVGASVRARVALLREGGGGARAGVEGYGSVLAEAVLAVGGRDRDAFAPLVAPAAAQVADLDAAAPGDLQPHLAILDVLNSLQVMGVEVPPATLATCRDWLAGMETAHVEPERWHWARGLAALALGDLATARTIAALPETGPPGVDPAVDPGLNLQAWLALLVTAVERRMPWADLAARWEELLDLLPAFVEIDGLAEEDVAWLGRILRHDVAGAPLGEVADWIHAEVHRVAGLPPPAP